jgi:lysine 2,3-aminomutase
MKMQNLTMLEEKITPHLGRLIESGSVAVERQFREIPQFGLERFFKDDDPLGEESRYSPVKGIVHKFSNRILWKVSYRCAAHCQFCTRARQIGSPEGDLSDNDIENALVYIANHREVDDVILSGGDPFVTPHVAMKIISGLTDINTVKMIRIGTRLPIHAPGSFRSGHVGQLLSMITEITKSRPIIVLVHINHPDELTVEAIAAINSLRMTGSILMTQTVFLNGVNDDMDVLKKLFKTIYHIGMIPHYLYHCDSVRGLERFIVPIKKEQEIVTELRRRLSGISVPTHVVDVPGKGKIDIPKNFWRGVDFTSCSDYDGMEIDLTDI